MKKFLLLSSASMLVLVLALSLRPSPTAGQESPQSFAHQFPYQFFLTHYEFLGEPHSPEGVRYHPNGKPSSKAADGSSITMSGEGGWDPSNGVAGGGGAYTIRDAAGGTVAQGAWKVVSFISFDQLALDDWWGIPGFREEGWQGPPGSVSFSGFLNLNVNLSNFGDAVLRAWCLMPTAGMHDKHVGDGISLSGPGLEFTGFEEVERSMLDSLEGVMFYSTDPNATGWVLNPAGISVAKDEGLRVFEAPSSPDGYNPN